MLSGSKPTNESGTKRKKVDPECHGGNFPGSLQNLPHSLELKAWRSGASSHLPLSYLVPECS